MTVDDGESDEAFRGDDGVGLFVKEGEELGDDDNDFDDGDVDEAFFVPDDGIALIVDDGAALGAADRGACMRTIRTRPASLSAK